MRRVTETRTPKRLATDPDDEPAAMAVASLMTRGSVVLNKGVVTPASYPTSGMMQGVMATKCQLSHISPGPYDMVGWRTTVAAALGSGEAMIPRSPPPPAPRVREGD